MNKQTRKCIGLVLILASFFWVLCVTLWLAIYWPVYKSQPKEGFIVWFEPYAEFTEPYWFFSWQWWIIPIILVVAGILLRGEIKSYKTILFVKDLGLEILYFVVGIFASALILLSILPQIHWILWARFRLGAYGIILLGVVYYLKQKYSSKARR